MNFKKMIVVGVASVMSVVSAGVFADTVDVKGAGIKWDPAVVFVKPGDTIKFSGMAGHDTAAYEGLVPEGADVWKSKMGEEGFTVTLTKEGAYIYRCNPHAGMGMVGAIVVGAKPPANLDKIKAAIEADKKNGPAKRAVKELEGKL